MPVKKLPVRAVLCKELSLQMSPSHRSLIGDQGPELVPFCWPFRTCSKSSFVLRPILEMQEFSKVYLDFNATTPLSTEVQKKIVDAMSVWGNPSSIHWAGRLIKTELREARRSLAMGLGVGPLELIFTSGASEASNTVIQGLWNLILQKELPEPWAGRREFITSTVEHPSVMKAMAAIEKRGAIVHRIPVARDGAFDLAALQQCLNDKTLLVSVMLANNETGHVMPIERIVELAHSCGALVHTDATQALGKLPLNLGQLKVDYASLSAHKFYAPKGTGVLFTKKGSPHQNLIFGGAQERSRRGGTENTLGQIALGEAMKKISEVSFQFERLAGLRDHLESRILQEIPEVTLTGSGVPRLPNTSSLVIRGVDGETMLMSLDLKGFAVSTGAACSSGSPEPSPVLLAMGLTREEAQNSLRVSLGWTTTAAEVDAFVETLKGVVHHLREIAKAETGTTGKAAKG